MHQSQPAVLLLELPQAALAGVDLLSFTVTPQFRGIRGLPAGLHFVFVSPHSTLALRHGAWFLVDHDTSDTAIADSSHVTIKKWHPQAETLVPESDSAEILRHRANLGSIWQTGMAPYRQSAHDGDTEDFAMQLSTVSADDTNWSGLSRYVTPAYLAHIFHTTRQDHWHLSSSTETINDLAIPAYPSTTFDDVTALDDRPLDLLDIDLKRTWRDGATGRERTNAARDRSWYMLDLARRLNERLHGSDGSTMEVAGAQDPYILLAELQFTFLSTLTLNNFTCLEQWRDILRVILTSYTAVHDYWGFFTSFLVELRRQIRRLSAVVEDALPVNLQASGDTNDSREALRRSSSKIDPTIPLEDQTEAELLAYDLPVRGGRKKRDSKALDQARPEPADARSMQTDLNLSESSQDDELRQLFLETESDLAGDSFLRLLLVRFRKGIAGTNTAAVTTTAQGKVDSSAPQGQRAKLLRALSALESTLFEQYGWTFDTSLSSSSAATTRATHSTVRGADGASRSGATDGSVSRTDNAAMNMMPQLDSTGYPLSTFAQRFDFSSPSQGSLARNTLHNTNHGNGDYGGNDDDFEDDDEGEFAPAVVALSQAELDALGMSGAISAADVRNADERTVKDGRTRDTGMGVSVARATGGMLRDREGLASEVVDSASDDDSEDDEGGEENKEVNILEDEEEELDNMPLEDMDERY